MAFDLSAAFGPEDVAPGLGCVCHESLQRPGGGGEVGDIPTRRRLEAREHGSYPDKRERQSFNSRWVCFVAVILARKLSARLVSEMFRSA